MPRTPSPVDGEQRARLLAAKLRALLKRYWPEAADAAPAAVAGGMAVHQDGRAWAVVGDSDAGPGFARALLWGLHREVSELHVLADSSPALTRVARQAACFRTAVTVWAVVGAEIAAVDPEPLPAEPPLDPRAEPFRAVIEDAGAEAVVEWGTLHAEVLGLEVGRVFSDPEAAWLEVGIGKHDRRGNQLLWGDASPTEPLSRAVETVLAARRSGDFGHPINRLGRERWLRELLVRRPGAVGATRLDRIAPPTPLGDLRLPLVAPARGTTVDGADVIVACSVGFDPTFVPMAAELHAARGDAGTRLVLVVPEAGAHSLTRRAAGDLRAGATLQTVPDGWHLEREPV